MPHPTARMVSRPGKMDASAEYDGGVKDFPDTGKDITFDPATCMVIDLARKASGVLFLDGFTRGGSQYTC